MNFVENVQLFPDSPIGQVPFLEIDELKLPQSLSIARYLAREYNLVGKSNLDAAKADAIVDTCIDLMTAFYYKVFMAPDGESKVSNQSSMNLNWVTSETEFGFWCYRNLPWTNF